MNSWALASNYVADRSKVDIYWLRTIQERRNRDRVVLVHTKGMGTSSIVTPKRCFEQICVDDFENEIERTISYPTARAVRVQE